MADKSSPQYISDKRKQQIFDNLIDYVSEHTTDEKDFYYSLRDIIGLTNEEMTQLGIDVKSLGINDEEDDLEESKKITEDTEFYTDEALKVLDYIQNEMTNEQRKKLFKDECGDFEFDNEADQLKEFWDWIELLDSDDLEELGNELNIIEEPEYQSDKEQDTRKINESNDLEEKEKHSEELQNIDKNYQLKNGDYFHFHTNEEGYYYTIYDKFGFEQDGGLLEYSDNEENETLMSIRKRLADFTDIKELADVNLKEVSQEDMDYITSGQKTEERKPSSEDEEEDER